MIDKYLNFVALDFETTGLEATAEIIEIGLVEVRGGHIVDSWQSLIKPEKSIPHDISVVTGISNQMVADSPSWAEIEEEFLERIQGKLLLAHNCKFDKGRLDYQLQRESNNEWMDTYEISKLFLPTLSSYKLMAIATHLGIDDDDHHRALNDAMVCARVYLELVKSARSLDPFVLEDMSNTYSGKQETLFASEEYGLSDFLASLAEDAKISGQEPDFDDQLAELYGDYPFSEIPALSFEHADTFFAENGLLSEQRKDFQYRPQQLEMLNCIREAFLTEKHALIEAGTGTGKSFAYLLPSLLWSLEHGTPVIIATGTINLQEQIYHTDLPFLSKALGYDFPVAIAKGRSNYLCRRRFESYCSQASELWDGDRLLITSLVLWSAQDRSGDKEHLNLNKAENQTWQNIASTSETCLGRRCPHFEDCCYFNNKRQCEQSNLIVTNHSLLFQDLRLGGLLPEYDYVVIDEAHHLEDEATHQFTDIIDFELMRKLCNNFTRNSGFLTRLKVSLGKSEDIPENLDEILKRCDRANIDLVDTIDSLQQCVKYANDVQELANIGDLRITDKIRNTSWWLTLEELMRKSHRYLNTTITSLKRVLSLLDDIESIDTLRREMNFSLERLTEQRDWLERFIGGMDEDFVYWATTYQNKSYSYANLLLSTAYINVMPIIHDKLFVNKKSVVLTSATLAVGQNLNYTMDKFMLDQENCLTYITDAPFDYEKQSLIAIVNNHRDYSKTSDIEYTRNIIDDLTQLIPAVDGDMLVLFTSYAMLNRTYKALKEAPALQGYRILAHGQDGSRSSLLEALQSDEKTVVLGANSFWEGIDVKGNHLRTVVISKLPFVPPTMPIESARNELLQANGKNPFSSNSLPQAILRFRQGCGRLIRSKEDHGCVIILDNRVLTKNYGKTFLGSLPRQRVIQDSAENLAGILEKWHQDHTL